MIAVFALTCFVAVSGPEHNGDAWPLWRAYVMHFVSADGRVIDCTNGDRKISEGQAYALFFVLVANGRKRFAQLLRWTEDNLSAGPTRDQVARLALGAVLWLFNQGRYHFAVDGALYPSRESQCISQ